MHTEGRPTLRPGLTLQLPPAALYNYAGYTRPAFRGLGLQAWRHRALLDHPAWADFDTVWGYVRATNFASQRLPAGGHPLAGGNPAALPGLDLAVAAGAGPSTGGTGLATRGRAWIAT